ncbi:MAG TPA: periplasmic heavy metal sensor [Candidatus Sulfotelmatobacter sp.]|nr:periplasmic heavy metal sensor [Candidatus Sulfotelmatobacter sp.]
MNSKKYLSGLLMIMLVAGLAGSALAWPGQAAGKMKMDGLGMGRGGQGGEEKMFSRLDLTAEQKSQMLEKRQALEKDLLALRQENQTLRLKIGEEMAKDQPDRGKLTGYFKEVNDNRGQMEIKRLDFILDIKAGLTPEQKAKFKGYYGSKTEKK